MKTAIVYIHGKGGNAEEAAHYRPLFPECRVLGFNYRSQTPWEAKEEFQQYFAQLCGEYDAVSVIANSIGAYFLMQAPLPPRVQTACFISPIVDMEALILKMMLWAGVTEEELSRRQTIPTAFGETLSWEYLSYVRENPTKWSVPTRILCAEGDNLTDRGTVSEFAARTGAALEVMPGGEHWFHTEEQMAYLDRWLKSR